MKPCPRARMRPSLAVAALALALTAGALAGCARRPPAPAPPPPARPAPGQPVPAPAETARVRPHPGYDGLRERLDSLDTRRLAGLRVAIDPGHGGAFPGSIGVNGLTEAAVNLGVSRALRDLLVARGAVVMLTREDDRDFLSPADSSLRTDLAERVRRANAFAPDLFVSVHHNADPGGRHDVNETQTYYKLGDDGPSLDVAQDVHRALVRNVGIATHSVVPGNYFVIRNSDAPALLTETSYLTNPDVEERLRDPARLAIEAEALAIGIARWAARPVPLVARFDAVADGAALADSALAASDPVLVARIAGPADHVALTVNGMPETPVRYGDSLAWAPALPWEHGRHEARLAVRLSGAGSARERRVRFAVRRPPHRIAVTPPGPLTPGTPAGALRLELRDAWGRVIRDSGEVVVRRVAGGGAGPLEQRLRVRDGVAWGVVERKPEALPGEVRFRAATVADSGGRRRELGVEFSVHVADAGPAAWRGFVRRMPDDVPLSEAPGTAEPSPSRRWLNREGFATLPLDSAGRPLAPALPGFRRWGADTLPPRYVPLFGGVLAGRRILLDPDAGGPDAGGVGPGGTRASLVNLEVARILAGFLRAAGAEVRLTRNGDAAVSEQERVQASEAFGSDRYLRIGHRARAPWLGFWYSSAPGRRWAQRTARAFEKLGLPAPAWGEEGLYPLQQVAATALFASPARLDDSTSEARLLAPGALRAEAYALLVGLAHEWAPDTAWAVDSLTVRDGTGAPVAGALVTLGGALVLQTDALGRVRFVRSEAGPIEAVVEDSRVRARAVLLDSARGAVLTGPRDR